MAETSVGISLRGGPANAAETARLQTHPRARMFAITFLSDLLAFACSVAIANAFLYLSYDVRYTNLGLTEQILFVMICFSQLVTSRLYPGTGINPAIELKTITHLTFISLLITFTFSMLRFPFWTQDKLLLALIGALSAPLILGMRWVTRILAVQISLWGEPVAVVARADKLAGMMSYFDERCRLGLIPVVGVALGNSLQGAAPVSDIDELMTLSHSYLAENGIHTVLVSAEIAPDLMNSRDHQDVLRRFKRTIFVSEAGWLTSASTSCHDFESMLGMEVPQNFLTPLDQLFKRLADILLSILLGILSLPMLLVIALLIKLDSPGPVFYKQVRVGKDGRKITIFKFRSMQTNADKVLADHVREHPDALLEWMETQKLRQDPRITRVGRWLRKFSVDEIPQLLNVLRGEMSLVGPRPIMLEQRKIYGDGLDVYTSVRPGLTGFWQVSGRNRTSFCQRAAYDIYYVRNWSVWLDAYILLRTVWVVLSRDGAY